MRSFLETFPELAPIIMRCLLPAYKRRLMLLVVPSLDEVVALIPCQIQYGEVFCASAAENENTITAMANKVFKWCCILGGLNGCKRKIG